IRILIEAQHLPGKGHPECHQQEEHANDPCEFAGKLVCAKEKDLHHVDKDDRHHEVRPPSVHSADEPAQGDFMVQSLKATPCLACRGHINEGQQNSGHELEKKNDECCTAKHIPPARSVSRYRVLCGFADRSG